jgi:hypothetical protein
MAAATSAFIPGLKSPGFSAKADKKLRVKKVIKYSLGASIFSVYYS